MRLVVDSNILFSALIKDSFTRRLIFHIDAELLTIAFSHKEIMKYKLQIIKKSNMPEEKLEEIFKQLKDRLITIDENLFSNKMKQANEIMGAIDPNDTPFIAAALATGADIWSDDKHFEQQNKVKVWKTKDLIQFL